MVRWFVTAASIAVFASMTNGVASAQAPTIQGAWNAQVYRLATGQAHAVRGQIFFAGAEWQVLFFVMENDEPRRGSGEGGTYTLVGDQLTFEHHYMLAMGEEMPGLPAAPLRMEAREGSGPSEETRIELTEERLILHFPSGNSMAFTRSR